MINKAQIKDDVLAKTNEIIDEVNDHDSKIMNLLTWMGLVKDYVVETGSNANGRYEKWASGKLVQTKVVIVARTATSNYIDYTWTFPIPFVRDADNVYTGSFECVQQGVGYRYGKLLTHFSSGVTQKIFRGKDEDSNLFNDYKFRLKAEGTWK